MLVVRRTGGVVAVLAPSGGTVITFNVSSAIGTQVGTGQGAAWGEAWEGEPYVDVGEGLCSTVCWWSPRLLFDLTEVP